MKIIEVIVNAGHEDTLRSIAEQYEVVDFWRGSISEATGPGAQYPAAARSSPAAAVNAPPFQKPRSGGASRPLSWSRAARLPWLQCLLARYLHKARRP